MKISAVLLTRDKIISDIILEGVRFADEILVIIDSEDQGGGTKSTGNITYYFHPLNNDYAAQRNFALSKAKGDWVLFVDDDEIVSPALGKEIQNIDQSTNFEGFYLPRIDVVFHDRLLHGETGNTQIVRLGRRKSGKFQRKVHEVWQIKGRLGVLNNPLYHIKDNFVSEFIPRISQYAPIDSFSLSNESKPFTLWRLFVLPPAKFVRNYFVNLGFLDGYPGLFQAYLMSVQSLSVRIFQWNHER